VVQAYAPEIRERLQGQIRYKRATWFMDEMYVRIARLRQCRYLNNIVEQDHRSLPKFRKGAPFSPLHCLQPYQYGTIACMKKTLHIDDKLLKEARAACGAITDTDTVRLGLESLVRHAAYERLRLLGGSEPDAKDVPRRRETRKG
jgi:hypothetical protein